ncbi:MAG: hypothetical protein QT04_C0050G0022 [archaeon GW2011_AR11]|nr:MAG: hypothetical protein QT04_C0050G0022 [archaeon GW2011_AR11]
MNKKQNLICILIIAVSLIVIVFVINSEPKETIHNEVTEKNITKCPKQGMLQSDWDYCVELCIFDKEEGASSRVCEQVCDIADRLDGSYGTEHMDKRIQKYKCEKCNDGCNP